MINVMNIQHSAAGGRLHPPVGKTKPHLSDVEPVADDSVRGLGVSLRPLQVV